MQIFGQSILGYIAGVKLEYQVIQLWFMLFKGIFKSVRRKFCTANLTLIPWDFLAMMFSEVVAFLYEKALFGIAVIFAFGIRTAIRTSVIFWHIHFPPTILIGGSLDFLTCFLQIFGFYLWFQSVIMV